MPLTPEGKYPMADEWLEDLAPTDDAPEQEHADHMAKAQRRDAEGATDLSAMPAQVQGYTKKDGTYVKPHTAIHQVAPQDPSAGHAAPVGQETGGPVHAGRVPPVPDDGFRSGGVGETFKLTGRHVYAANEDDALRLDYDEVSSGQREALTKAAQPAAPISPEAQPAGPDIPDHEGKHPAYMEAIRGKIANLAVLQHKAEGTNKAIGQAAEQRLDAVNKDLDALRPQVYADEGAAKRYQDLVLERGRLHRLLS